MKQVTVFRNGFLSGSSFTSHSAQELYTGDYDLMILVSSWDKRSVSITESSSLRATNGALILFNNRDSEGMRDKHDPILKTFIDDRCDNSTVITGDSLDVENVWSSIWLEVVKASRIKGGPLRIFIDASSCPRYYVLAVLGYCLGEGLAKEISICYGEGYYPEQSESINGPEEIAFTRGHWKSVAIPSLEGRYSPGKQRHYLVSVGFEGWKTMRVVSRADPDRVSVLFPEPGFKKDYSQRTTEDNQILFDQYQIPDNQIIRAHAGDAIAAWKELTESSPERPDTENAYYLCSGTKAHSIALGLRSLCLGHPAVLYNLPEEHRFVRIEPSNIFWRFDIDSLTVPT